MRHPFCLGVTALFLCAAYSCRQTIIEPHPGGHGGDNTLSINLMYPNTDTTDFGSSFELIISEPGGKILLDTLAPYNVSVIAKMTTTKPLVDVSTVIYSPTFDFYSMTIYKSVQPAEWITMPNNPIPLTSPNGIPATITYTSPPQVDQNTIHFAALPTTSTIGAGISSYTNDQLGISYSGISGSDIAYLIFPTLGLYSYQTVHSVNDTISLSQMDTTVKVFYNMPPQYTLAVSFLNAYLDTTDFTKILNLYSYFEPLPLGDLQYPPRSRIPFQKYSLQVEASTANNEFLSYRSFGTAAPTGTLTPPFPAMPIYTLNSTGIDSFSVSFLQLPTNYTTNWSAGNINVSITASSDSTLIRALSLTNSLHSKLLQGKSLSGLSFQNFGYENVPGQSYSGYYLHQTNPDQLTKNPFASDLVYVIFQ